MDIAKLILETRTVTRDFPEEGIGFIDLSPIYADAEVFERVTGYLARKIQSKHANCDVIVGVDARGFVMGSAVATKLKKAFVPIRKVGKLPPPVLSENYALEYGSATVEINESLISGKKAVIIDDVLATGGTAIASLNLVQKAGGEVLGMYFLDQAIECEGLGRVTAELTNSFVISAEL